jgi:hypothetical protein
MNMGIDPNATMWEAEEIAAELAGDRPDTDGLSEAACLLLQAVEDASGMSPAEFLETYGADALRLEMRQGQGMAAH